jgi:hypothetical protein
VIAGVTSYHDLNLFTPFRVALKDYRNGRLVSLSRLFVRAIDVGVFAEVALASLCNNEVVALELHGDSAIGVRTLGFA